MNKKRLAISKLQKGGKAYIPDGKMHRYKHGIDPDDVGIPISENGIPLIGEVCDDGKCQIKQLAEIEAAEIIFTNHQSQVIEKLVEKYNNTKDEEILIQLGKEVKLYLKQAEDATGKFSKQIKKIKT